MQTIYYLAAYFKKGSLIREEVCNQSKAQMACGGEEVVNKLGWLEYQDNVLV